MTMAGALKARLGIRQILRDNDDTELAGLVTSLTPSDDDDAYDETVSLETVLSAGEAARSY